MTAYPEPQPATEVVTVDRFADLLPGDIVVETDRTYDGDLVRVRRACPPKPKLPTTNGSIVTQAYQDKDADLGRIAAFLLNGTWYDTARPGRRVGVPSDWATGWTLIYEAPPTPNPVVIPSAYEIELAITGNASLPTIVSSSDAARRAYLLFEERNQ